MIIMEIRIKGALGLDIIVDPHLPSDTQIRITTKEAQIDLLNSGHIAMITTEMLDNMGAEEHAELLRHVSKGDGNEKRRA